MYIKFYGTRGSIAVANKETKKYGGNTTCMYVETDTGEAIIIDAGTGIRELGAYLLQKRKLKMHLIFSHYHWDHIQGFPFFAPIFFSNAEINIYGAKEEISVRKALNYQMTLPYFPATLKDLRAKLRFKELKNRLKIGNMTIQTIPTNHPNYTVAFKFTEGKHCFAFLTDNELHAKGGNTPYKKFVNFVKGVDFFIHDAQYTDDIYQQRVGWGHSTYNQVMQLARDAGVKSVIFTHHDHGSTDQFIDDRIKELRGKYRTYHIQAAADGKTIILK